MLNLVLALVLALFVVCIIFCFLDVQDYKQEFPDGDPNKGSEGSVLIGGMILRPEIR